MTEWHGGERNGLSSLSLGGGAGQFSGAMEQRLRGIVGGSLEQLSESLHYLPASRTNALPSTEARALLSSVGFNDTPPPDISALLRQPGYSDGGANGAGAQATEAPQPSKLGTPTRDDTAMGEPVAYEQMTGKVRPPSPKRKGFRQWGQKVFRSLNR